MGYYFTREDTDLIKRSMSAVDAAQIFCNSEIKGDNIICPSRLHDDKRHGSCKIMNGKIYCFACQKSFGSCIDVVCDYYNVDFHESLIIIAEKLGILDRFDTKGAHREIVIKKPVIRCLSDEEKALIGLYAANSYIGPGKFKVKTPKGRQPRCYCGYRDEKDENTIPDEKGDGYLVSTPVTINHLWLANEDPLAYRTMVLNKCYEKMAEIDTKIQQEWGLITTKKDSKVIYWHRLVIESLEEEWIKVYELGKKYGLSEVEVVKKQKHMNELYVPLRLRTA